MRLLTLTRLPCGEMNAVEKTHGRSRHRQWLALLSRRVTCNITRTYDPRQCGWCAVRVGHSAA